MRLQFINPPFIGRFSRSQRSPGVIKSGTMYYPYWLAHAAALAEQRGFEIDLVDCPAAGVGIEDLIARATSFRPGLMVVDTSTPSIESDVQVAAKLKAAVPDSFVLLVGTHPSAVPDETLGLSSSIDAVAVAEYDLTVSELAEALGNGKDCGSVRGLVLRQEGDLVHTGARPPLANLDLLPPISPIYKRFLNVRDYYFSLASYPMVMLISGRGCPNQCFFCVYPQVMHGRRYRYHSPEHVVAEMEYVKREMPEVKEIVFEDDTFTANPKRTRRICELILERGLKLPWFANIRVDTDLELLKLMRQAGLSCCAVGYESGSQALLDAMHKGITLEQSRRFAENARQAGILVHGCFMVGFPGETRETMEQTLVFAMSLGCDSAQFYPIYPYPGTQAYEWLKSQGYLRAKGYREWLDEGGGHQCVFDLPGLSQEEMTAFCDQAYRRFHLRPTYLVGKVAQLITRPREGVRSLRSGLYFARSLLRRGRSC